MTAEPAIARVDKGLRYETKYLVPVEVQTALRCDLHALLEPDPHSAASFDGYRVESLYFDTPRRANYTEKLDGVAIRRKFRIRQYDDDSSFRCLELKERVHDRQRKSRTRLSNDVYDVLLSGRWTGSHEPALKAFHVSRVRTGLRPWLLLRYRRTAYTSRVQSDVRATLDQQLEARSAHAFERPLSPYFPVLSPRMVIVEFKWRETLPDSLQSLVRKYGLRNAALSKYCLAMDALVRSGATPNV